MDRHTIILTTDKRQEELGVLFPGKKVRCPWEEYKRDEICEKIYVLPTPVSKLHKYQGFEKKLKEELTNCKGPLCVFGGAFPQEWKIFLEENGILYWDFMQMPEVVGGNAWITAEATVAEVLQCAKYSIREQKVLITGYGCCGEKLAHIFAALGAEVTVAARRQEVRERIEADGYRSVSFEEMAEAVAGMQTIVNTVPALVVTEEVVRNLPKDAMIIDIASAPGGTDFEAAGRYGICAKLALGLPGIYTVGSSAKLLQRAIQRYAPIEKTIGEEQEWIFQIVI